MRKVLIILVGVLIIGCNNSNENENSYEKGEFKAIQDFANDYLKRNHLGMYLEYPPSPGEESAKIQNIDTLNLKVYISDALLPIAQVKEDNEWMFNDNYFGTSDSAIFHKIVNSQRFNELGYREFDKSKFKLIKPYKQFKKSQENITADELYTILNFSRVCFDEKKETGVVVIEYLKGFKSGHMSGYHMALLIKKEEDKWKYIVRE